MVIASPVGGGDTLVAGLANLPSPGRVLVVDSDFPAYERLSADIQARLRQLGRTILFTSEAGAVELQFDETTGWRLRSGREP